MELMTVSTTSNSLNRVETLQRIGRLPVPDVQKEDLITAVRNLQRRGQWERIDEILAFPWGVFSKGKSNVERARAILEGFIADSNSGDVIKKLAEYAIVLSKHPNTRLPNLKLFGMNALFHDTMISLMGDLLGRPVREIPLAEETKAADIMDNLVNALWTAKCCNPVIVVKANTIPEDDKAYDIVRQLRRESHKSVVDRYTGVSIDLSNVLFVIVNTPSTGSLTVTEEDLVGLIKMVELPPLLAEHGLEGRRHLFSDAVLRAIVASSGLKALALQLNHVPGSSWRGRFLRKFSLMMLRLAGDQAVQQLVRQKFDKLMNSVVTFLSENPSTAHPSAVINFLKTRGCAEWSFDAKSVKPLQSRPFLPVGYAAVLGVHSVFGYGTIDTLYSIFSSDSGRSKETEEQRQMVDIAYNYCRNNASKYGISSDVLENPIKIKFSSNLNGLSMGCAMFLSVFSLFTNRRVRTDTAVSGEITPSGRICPIGRLYQKTNAAYRWGVRRMVFASGNREEVEREADEMHKEEMEFIYVDTLDELVEAMVEQEATTNPLPSKGSRAPSRISRKAQMSEYLGWDEHRPPTVLPDREDLKRPSSHDIIGGPASQGYENYVRNIFRPGAKVPGEQKISALNMLKMEEHLGKHALDESLDIDTCHSSALGELYGELGLSAPDHRSYVQFPVYTPKQSSEWFSRSHNLEPRPSQLVGSGSYSLGDRHASYGGYSSYREKADADWKKNNTQMLVDYQKFDSSPLSPYMYQSHPYVHRQDSRIVGSNFVQLTTRPRDRFLDKIDRTLAEVRAMPRYC